MQDFNLPKIPGSIQPANEMSSLQSEAINIVEQVGQTPTPNDGSDENNIQLGVAVASYASHGDYYIDSGVANSYVLMPDGNKKGIYIYSESDGARIRFRPQNTNTAACTVNVNGNGVKNIKLSDAVTSPAAGQIRIDELMEIVYNLVEDAWILMNPYSDSVNFNGIVNGGMSIATRQPYTLVNGVAKVGLVDAMIGKVTGTAVSAGILTQGTGQAYSETSYTMQFAGVTVTGSGVIEVDHLTESDVAVLFKNKTSAVSLTVYHDVGTPINYQITVLKPTVKNNFTSTTQIAQSALISVQSATPTLITLPNISMGDCSNGIQTIVTAACGAVSTKNFHVGNLQINSGTYPAPFVIEDPIAIRMQCRRRYLKSYQDAVPVSTPASNASNYTTNATGTTGGADPAVIGNIRFPLPMIVVPTCIVYALATGNANNMSAGDAADIAAASAEIGTTGFLAVNSATVVDNANYDYHIEADTGW